VTDWCTESFPDFGAAQGDGAMLRLPKDSEGYAVFARITGNPGDPAAFTFVSGEAFPPFVPISRRILAAYRGTAAPRYGPERRAYSGRTADGGGTKFPRSCSTLLFLGGGTGPDPAAATRERFLRSPRLPSFGSLRAAQICCAGSETAADLGSRPPAHYGRCRAR
jgi:hypothetical protein